MTTSNPWEEYFYIKRIFRRYGTDRGSVYRIHWKDTDDIVEDAPLGTHNTLRCKNYLSNNWKRLVDERIDRIVLDDRIDKILLEK